MDFVISASDGYPIAATLDGVVTDRLVIVHSATATPRHFYRHFATALVEQGFAVLRYDYRGIGGSRPENMRALTARMRDWAFLDMQAVVDWASEEHPSAGQHFVGHSFGGQTAGMLERVDKVRSMATISSQSGYWRLQGAEQKWMVGLHVHMTLPFFAHTLGYVPWRRLGASDDLPQNVAKEWARWCRHPDYLLGDQTLPLDRYANFTAPVLAYSIDDDKWGTRKAVDAMMRVYPNLRREFIAPQMAGQKSLGHFGYFRRSAAALWPGMAEFFLQH